MPVSALPPGYDNSQTGDWNFWPFNLIRPSWTAFGPRCTQWWAKFRAVPFVIFKVGAIDYSGHVWRYEMDIMSQPKTYFSAIQYWKRWSIQLQWPLFFAFHWYWKVSDVPVVPNHPTVPCFYFRIGARRNADGFYDFPSAHIGDFN